MRSLLVILALMAVACLAGLSTATEYTSEADCKKTWTRRSCAWCCRKFDRYADLHRKGSCKCSLLPQEVRDELSRHESTKIFGYK